VREGGSSNLGRGKKETSIGLVTNRTKWVDKGCNPDFISNIFRPSGKKWSPGESREKEKKTSIEVETESVITACILLGIHMGPSKKGISREAGEPLKQLGSKS